jgi:NDP-sugar pyrophosphorylase family protein
MEKYKLYTSETKVVCGRTLHRIQALKNFSNVKEGDLGGWIEKESNLSQDGDAWVYNEAEVHGNARVYGNAQIFDEAKVYDYALVCDNAKVFDVAKIHGYAKIFDEAEVCDEAEVYGDALVCGTAQVCGTAKVHNNAIQQEELSGTYYVQETIGGWRQPAIFKGTLEECQKYYRDYYCGYGNSIYHIVHEEDYEVDYL